MVNGSNSDALVMKPRIIRSACRLESQSYLYVNPHPYTQWIWVNIPFVIRSIALPNLGAKVWQFVYGIPVYLFVSLDF